MEGLHHMCPKRERKLIYKPSKGDKYLTDWSIGQDTGIGKLLAPVTGPWAVTGQEGLAWSDSRADQPGQTHTEGSVSFLHIHSHIQKIFAKIR